MFRHITLKIMEILQEDYILKTRKPLRKLVLMPKVYGLFFVKILSKILSD